MKRADGNVLKKNFSEWAIFSILNNTKIKGKPAIAWKIVSGKKVTAEVFIRVIRKSRGEILLRGVDIANQKTLADLLVGAEHLNIYLPEAMALFQTEVKGFEPRGDATLKIPSMMAQVDRRKHMRLFMPEEPLANIKFFKQAHGQRGNTQLFEKPCFDISAGGLSFIVSKMESKFFVRGDAIKTIKITAEQKEIAVSGRIVNIFDIEPDLRNGLHYRGLKVCVRYENISPQDQKYLDDFVFRHCDLTEAV